MLPSFGQLIFYRGSSRSLIAGEADDFLVNDLDRSTLLLLLDLDGGCFFTCFLPFASTFGLRESFDLGAAAATGVCLLPGGEAREGCFLFGATGVVTLAPQF